MSTSDLVDDLGGLVTAKDEAQVEHRLSCHRCGNIRKSVYKCAVCPQVFCVRCYEKMSTEHGKDSFIEGCPTCKSLCCCANTMCLTCPHKFHCYKKCRSHKMGGNSEKENGCENGVEVTSYFLQGSIPAVLRARNPNVVTPVEAVMQSCSSKPYSSGFLWDQSISDGSTNSSPLASYQPDAKLPETRRERAKMQYIRMGASAKRQKVEPAVQSRQNTAAPATLTPSFVSSGPTSPFYAASSPENQFYPSLHDLHSPPSYVNSVNGGIYQFYSAPWQPHPYAIPFTNSVLYPGMLESPRQLLTLPIDVFSGEDPLIVRPTRRSLPKPRPVYKNEVEKKKKAKTAKRPRMSAPKAKTQPPLDEVPVPFFSESNFKGLRINVDCSSSSDSTGCYPTPTNSLASSVDYIFSPSASFSSASTTNLYDDFTSVFDDFLTCDDLQPPSQGEKPSGLNDYEVEASDALFGASHMTNYTAPTSADIPIMEFYQDI